MNFMDYNREYIYQSEHKTGYLVSAVIMIAGMAMLAGLIVSIIWEEI